MNHDARQVVIDPGTTGLGTDLTHQEGTRHTGPTTWISRTSVFVGRISRTPTSYISLSELRLQGDSVSCQIQGESESCVG